MRVHEKTAWMLRKNIAVERFRELRCKALPLAEAAGYVADEDIFRDISRRCFSTPMSWPAHHTWTLRGAF